MRFSVRDFGKEPISKDKLEDAFKLCERKPSACNRQSWRLHVYTEREQIDKICKLQLGCKGFSEDFQGVILLCADIRCYAFQEMNQYFFDGGIYAMNLLYALQANDIASIPLTMGHKTAHLNHIKRVMQIPANEQPILLVGYGSFKDRWKVAASKRNRWQSYVSWNS
nr:nitroreductase family protein [uncultured Prevotella sp.]